jgi:hypothetical protein
MHPKLGNISLAIFNYKSVVFSILILYGIENFEFVNFSDPKLIVKAIRKVQNKDKA